MVEQFDITNVPEWNMCLNMLLDDQFSEIEVNGPGLFFTKRKGRRERIEGIDLGTEERYMEGIKKGLVPFVKSIGSFSENGYIFEGPLRYSVMVNGEEKLIRGRCHIVLPPAADSPQITIAKKSTSLPSLEAIATNGSMSSEMLAFLLAAIKGNLTMAISGGTGAGKDLHKDTPILTSTGMQRLEDVRVGDTVFDETGMPTRVTAKYKPLDPIHYNLTFQNREVISAGMGHLWKVSLLNSELNIKTPALFTPAVAARLQAKVRYDVDQYITAGEVHALIAEAGGTTNATLLEQLLGGMGFRADNFFSLNVDEVIDKLEVNRLANGSLPAMVKALAALGDTATLGTVRGLMSDRETFDRLLPDAPSSDLQIFSKREIITHLLKKNNEFTMASFDSSHVPNFSTAIMTTAELHTMGVTNDRGALNFAVEGAAGSQRHYLTAIEQVDAVSEDYICLGVDSPTHMFLVGKALIPTHNTTLLEAVAKNFSMDARIGVAEDAPELYLSQPNTTYIHSVPWAPGMDANAVATLSWGVAQFQRMRTDKIIIGETRGSEFADFLVAANSGMDGSLTTLHADDPKRCLDKMTNFALRATNAPIRSVNNDIAQSLDLIVQLIYTADGRYRMSEICEITNTLSNDETAKITTNTLFKWDRLSDTFVKEAQMSDQLRVKFQNNGIDPNPFLVSQIGARAAAHASPDVVNEISAAAGSLPDSAPKRIGGLPRPAGLPLPGGPRQL